MILRYMEGPKKGDIVELTEDSLIIGSGESCNLVLDVDGVSRQHAKIVKQDEGYALTDLESTNGVYVNSTKVDDTVVLKSDDQVRIGAMSFCMVDDEPASSAKQQEVAVVTTEPPQDRPSTKPVQEIADGKGYPAVSVDSKVKGPGIKGFAPVVAEPIKEEPRRKAPAKARLKSDVKPKLKARRSAGSGQTYRHSTVVDKLLKLGVFVLICMLVYTALIKGNPQAEQVIQRLRGMEASSGADSGETSDLGTDAANGLAHTAEVEDSSESLAAQPVPPISVFDQMEKIKKYWFKSNPAGAVLYIEDRPVGTTPCLVTGLAQGQHSIRLTLHGHRDVSSLIAVPQTENVVFELDQARNTHKISSEPTGAAVMFGGQLIGETPFIVAGAGWAGKDLSIVASGYSPKKVRVKYSSVESSHTTVTLKTAAAKLSVIGLPSGGELFVDGVYRGIIPLAKRGESEPITIEGIKPGTREVHMVLSSGEESSPVAIQLELGRTSNLRLTIHKPDIEISAKNGETITGMFRRLTDEGNIVLAVSGKKDVTVKKDVILSTRRITD